MPEASLATAPIGFLLDGRWVSEGDIVHVHSPFDQRLVGSVFQANRQQLDAAIGAAVRAFSVTRKLASYERQRILLKIATGIGNAHEDFARSIALASS